MPEIEATGPVFDGRMEKAIRKGLEEAQAEVGNRGVGIVRVQLDRVLQHPTGVYRRDIQTDRASHDSLVTDGGAVYGPWLAGVGSRNETTRFKGYAHWRRATQQLQREASDIAGPIIQRHIGGV